MNWFDSLIPGIKKRRSKSKKGGVRQGVWTQCRSCQEAVTEEELARNLQVCVKCGFHHPLKPAERAAAVFDPDVSPKEIGLHVRPRDFLKFTDETSYKDRLARHRGDDPGREGLRAYSGQLGGAPCVVASFDWSFMGGSMGSVVGERFVQAVDASAALGAPFIVFTYSGGARMQEGLVALMQMAKTTAAQAKLGREALPFVSVLCNPTTGGVAASFALTGDIVIAEPQATIGFAGARVIRSTVRTELPAGFQTSEFLLDHGSVDMVVDRRQLRDTLLAIVGGLMEGRAGLDDQ